MNIIKPDVNHELLTEKLFDATIPGIQIEFDPEEATAVGAFIEHALTEEEAKESQLDSDARDLDND